MIGNYTKGYIVLFVVMIMHTGNFRNFLHYILHGIHFKQVIHTLQYTSKALKTHTRIYVLLNKIRIIAVSVIIELAENNIPKLRISVAITAGGAGRFTAAVFFTAVKIDLTARAARSLTMFPEIIFLTEPNDMGRINAYFIGPDIKRLIIVFIDRDPEFFHRHLKHFRAELPSPCSGFVLKVIAETEIAQHLKICAVARGFANSFNIRRADAFLACCNAL